MGKIFELIITAEIPDDNADLGHEAVVSTKAPAQAIVDALSKAGLVNVLADRRIRKAAVPRGPKAAAPIAAAEDALKAAE